MSISTATNSTTDPRISTTNVPPKLSCQNKVIEEIIAKQFTVAFQNVSEFEQAEVVLLGETHNEPFHRVSNGMLLDAAYRPQDIVLVENVPGYASRSKQVSAVERDITIAGWDHPRRLEAESSHTQSFSTFLKVIENLCFKPISRSDWLIKLGDLIKCYPQYRPQEEAYYRQEIEKEFGHYPKEEQTKIAELLICSISTEWLDFIYDYLDSTIPLRNECMIDQISSHSFSGRRVFVIAGNTHFTPPLKKELFVESARGLEILHSGLAGKKYVILQPKRNSKEESYIRYIIKKKWSSYSQSEKVIAVAATTGLTLLATALLPIVGGVMGARTLKRKLTPFHPTDLKCKKYDIRGLLNNYQELFSRYCYMDFDDFKLAEAICGKYNQPLATEGYFSSLMKEEIEALKTEMDAEIKKNQEAINNAKASITFLGTTILFGSKDATD